MSDLTGTQFSTEEIEVCVCINLLLFERQKSFKSSCRRILLSSSLLSVTGTVTFCETAQRIRKFDF